MVTLAQQQAKNISSTTAGTYSEHQNIGAIVLDQGHLFRRHQGQVTDRLQQLLVQCLVVYLCGLDP